MKTSNKIYFSLFFLIAATYVNSQEIKIFQAPEFYQLYARDKTDSAQVVIIGAVRGNGTLGDFSLKVYKDGAIYDQEECRVKDKRFFVSSRIHAGLHQFRFELYYKKDGKDSLCFVSDSVVCGDAFIISGQSNSHASSSLSTYSSPYCRSFGVKTGYEAYDENDKKIRWGRATGNCPELEGIGGWFTKNKYGVGVWGMELMRLIVEKYHVPVCIINGGSGSSSIKENMLYPEIPSMETSFGRFAYRINQAGLKDQVKAILWHQGETDSDQRYSSYMENFDILLNDWKRVYSGLQKIYLFQLHPGCGGQHQSEFREMQDKIADRYDMIDIMSTAGVAGHDGCHYTHEGYLEFADRIFPLLARDFYGEKYTGTITPPKLVRAFYSKESKNKASKIILEFDQDITLEQSLEIKGNIHYLKDQFFFGKNSHGPLIANAVKALNNYDNKIILKLRDNEQYNFVTYLPGKYYWKTKDVYNGPWIRGSQNNLGALSFDRRVISISPAGTNFAPDSIITYKTLTDKEGNLTDLKLHFFYPPNHKRDQKRPAIVFFFGGGWNGGSPGQFYPHCDYLASRGIVAISAEYRVKSRNNTSPRECVKDGKSAIRWIRQNAEDLGIDLNKLAAGGGSAGGHVAAATGTTKGFEEKDEDLSIISRPDALVLFNPVYDNSPSGYGYNRVKEYWREFSPMHNLSENTPPTIVFLGTNDKLIPVATAEKYKQLMEAKGRRCDLHLYEDQAHGFFNFRNEEYYKRTVLEMDRFLASLGHLKGEPKLAIGREDKIFNEYEIEEFTFKDHQAKIVFPHKSNDQKDWIWRARFWGHEPQTDIALLEQGFHVAYVEVGGLFGSEQAIKIWDDFYAFVTEKYQLNKKVVLEGMSRGGLIIYNWSNRNAEKVACIYGDAPVCDFKSWPMGKWTGKGSETDWQTCLKVYGMTEKEALEFKGNPVDHMENIAKAKVPILHVVGDKDSSVPVSENTEKLEIRLKDLGWQMNVIHKPNTGHHPHSLPDPKPIVDFILMNTGNLPKQVSSRPQWSINNVTLRSDFRNCKIQFKEQKKGHVAFIGGSITEMNGYRPMMCKYLQGKFPETKFTFTNAGIASTCSSTGAFRMERDVLSKGPLDLLFVEFAVNDDQDAAYSGEEAMLGMEAIIRKAKKHNPNVDIVITYFVNPDILSDYQHGKVRTSIVSHDAVAQNYNISICNLAKEVADQITVGTLDWNTFGGTHPKEFGNVICRGMIVSMLENAWTKKESAPIPNPLLPNNFENGQLVKPENSKYDKHWIMAVPDWNKLKGTIRPRFVKIPILSTEKKGAELIFEFTGKAVGVYILAGPDAGIAEVSIDGDTFKSYDLYHKYSKSLHYPRTIMFANNLEKGKHTLKLRMSKESSSKGNAVRIINFVVN